MIGIDRSRVAEPASLKARDRDNRTELDRARKHREQLAKWLEGGKQGKPVKAFDFATYRTGAVKSALEQLFHGKCAYCESPYAITQPVDVEHFRPKNAVDGANDHPGYWWLAMAWENLLPSCIDCNRRRIQRVPDPLPDTLEQLQGNQSFDWTSKASGKQAAFPLRGAFRAAREDDRLSQEDPLLLDPTGPEAPEDHLAFHLGRDEAMGLAYPRPDSSPGATEPSLMGAVSIQVYGLNRLALVQARAKHMRDLEFLYEMLVGMELVLREIDERRIMSTTARDASRSSRRREVDEELAFLALIARQLNQHRDTIRARMRDMTAESAPYAALSRAWLKARS